MIDVPVKTSPPADKVIEVIQTFEHDEFEYFLMNDPELDVAYMACLQAAGIEWTDEEAAEAAFRSIYGENIDDLMQAWRWQQALLNETHPDHQRAIAVHLAVLKGKRRAAQRKGQLAS